MPLLLVGLSGLAACSSLTPVDDPIYLRINDIEARLIRIERVLENESLISLAGDITELRNQVQSLLGEVETLGHNADNQNDRNRDLYVDLDQRLAQIEAAQSRLQSAPSAGAGGGAGGAVAVGDQQAYDAAFALIQQQNFAGAQGAFENFLATYPSSSLRGNAQYWLAESHYAQLQFTTALSEFQRVIDDYPQSSKLPDALLKIGYCNFELRNMSAARQALQQVVRQFPDTTAANLATERLRQIPQ